MLILVLPTAANVPRHIVALGVALVLAHGGAPVLALAMEPSTSSGTSTITNTSTSTSANS